MFGFGSLSNFLSLAVVLAWPPQCSNWYLARISKVWQFWISICLLFLLSFCIPCSLVPCAAHSNCLHLTKLWSLSPQLGVTIGLFLFSSLPCYLDILSRKKASVITGLTLFVSLLSGITVLHFLLSNVLKHFFRMFFPRFFFLFFLTCLKC